MDRIDRNAHTYKRKIGPVARSALPQDWPGVQMSAASAP
jgi:hypothetical protein